MYVCIPCVVGGAPRLTVGMVEAEDSGAAAKPWMNYAPAPLPCTLLGEQARLRPWVTVCCAISTLYAGAVGYSLLGSNHVVECCY